MTVNQTYNLSRYFQSQRDLLHEKKPFYRFADDVWKQALSEEKVSVRVPVSIA
ncbi:MAG: hypothetical protein LAT57_08060 [Balneolales bacterium]|nr:hypothetical protein [Balneolales bacterium]